MKEARYWLRCTLTTLAFMIIGAVLAWEIWFAVRIGTAIVNFFG